MTKTTNTISIENVASMLCALGINLSQQFDLDPTEVMEYLDSACEDKTGVNPQTADLFQKVVDEEDEGGEEDTPTVTREEIDEWFATTKKGGLGLAELREKAREYGLELDSKCKKSEIQEAFESLLVDEEEGDEEEAQPTPKPTAEDIESWCRPPGKDGLKLAELKAKAEELGVDLGETTKRSEIKALLLESCEEAPKIVVRRNKDLKCWYVEGTSLIIQSPKSKVVLGYITKGGERREKLTKAMKDLAEERGLSVK